MQNLRNLITATLRKCYEIVTKINIHFNMQNIKRKKITDRRIPCSPVCNPIVSHVEFPATTQKVTDLAQQLMRFLNQIQIYKIDSQATVTVIETADHILTQ